MRERGREGKREEGGGKKKEYTQVQFQVAQVEAGHLQTCQI